MMTRGTRVWRRQDVHLTFDLDGVATLAQLSFTGTYAGFGTSHLQSAADPLSPNAPQTPLTQTSVGSDRLKFQCFGD
jgi:hypothetical protein